MRKILVIAPHMDDEVLGVGGTIIKHIEHGDRVSVCCVSRGKPPVFEESEVGLNEARKCHSYLGVHRSFFLDYPAVMLETVDRYSLNGSLLNVIREVRPDTVYIPHWGDMQKDHRIVAEASMVAMRPKYESSPGRIYAYETLSETGWNMPNLQNAFIPNVYVDIENELSKKMTAMAVYRSELGLYPEARSIKALEALAHYRGSSMHMKAAEAFTLIREFQ